MKETQVSGNTTQYDRDIFVEINVVRGGLSTRDYPPNA